MMEDTIVSLRLMSTTNLTLKDFVTTICHEMVHVKQYARKETCGYGEKWKGRKINPKMTIIYWEKEAYKMQDKLAQLVWDADVL